MSKKLVFPDTNKGNTVVESTTCCRFFCQIVMGSILRNYLIFLGSFQVMMMADDDDDIEDDDLEDEAEVKLLKF